MDGRRLLVSIAFAALALTIATACSEAAPEPAPVSGLDLDATRVAEALRAIPTAAAVTTIGPLATDAPIPVPTAAPPATEPPQTAAATSAPAAGAEHVVVSGDTLSTIAAKYNTSIAALQLANNLDTQNVRAGARLKLPVAKLADDENVYWFVYVVRPGDTLGVLAQRFGVSDKDVLRVNKIADASRILIGQRLVIPVRQRSRTSVDNSAAAPVAPAQTAAPNAVAQPAVTPVPVAAELILLDAATPEPFTPTGPPQPVTDGAASQPAASAPAAASAMATALLTLYNEQRVAAGLPPLRYSPTLAASAQAHASECSARAACGHVGVDGSSSRERIRRAGYSGRWTGENWAWSATAAGAFDMWFHQETPDGPHRKNIMSPSYTEVGFGIGASGGGYFFIANLGG